MPKRKSNLSEKSFKARAVKQRRSNKTEEERKADLSRNSALKSAHRSQETPDQRERRLTADAERISSRRSQETLDQRERRLTADAERISSRRSQETPDQRELRVGMDRERHSSQRQNFIGLKWNCFKEAAFYYDPLIEYSTHRLIAIGEMTKECNFCRALKWTGETQGMCCCSGKVRLPLLDEPIEPLKSLLTGYTAESREFLKKIRQYNTAFQMTSFGVSGEIISHNFPSTFTVQGQVYHRLGSLLPPSDRQHKYLQIYFIGEENAELDTRCQTVPGVSRETVNGLQQILHEHNDLIRNFKFSIENWPSEDYKVVIQADRRLPGQHERRYNAPAVHEVAIVIAGNEFENRDIVLRKRDNSVLRIAETHRFYDALQYPLIFWKGQEGYHFQISQNNPITNLPAINKKVSAMHFYAFLIMVRPDNFNSILRYKQLLNQFIVDMFAKIESERLLYIKLNQSRLRSENYIHLMDAVTNDGVTNAQNFGQMVILPSSFTGSLRYMQQHAQDALTYVKHYGRPDLFITMTCNPNWKEIADNLFQGQNSVDRHDIVARVFRQKIIKFISVINKGELFGPVKCWMYTVEWQKRGLPHIHALIWLTTKIRPQQIDSIISAEIPNISSDPILFNIVIKNMVHGPCGPYNHTSPCMKNGKCSKGYPRPFLLETQTNDNGYPLYRRRKPEDGGSVSHINTRNVQVDNQWIVPFSPILCKIFNAHINVEYCSSVKSIKYICKYIHKGTDQAVFNLQGKSMQPNRMNEVEIYESGRYISSNEAFWRIFNFPIQERHPTVTHLSVHLENGQRIYFNESNLQEKLRNPPHSTLTAFFSLCQNDSFARTLLYSEVPHYYTWNDSRKEFKRRKQGIPVEGHPDIKSTDALGRVYTVHVKQFECYCLRLLLHRVRGPTSFQHLRTVDNIVYTTYREACEAMGLLQNDRHWESTMQEAALCRSAQRLRYLFSIILSTCDVTNPRNIWETYKNDMAEDILFRYRHVTPHLNFNEDIYNQALNDIEKTVVSISGKQLDEFGLPRPHIAIQINNEVIKEMSYDLHALQQHVEEMLPKLQFEQRQVFDLVIEMVNRNEGAIFFLDAPGGTGKTFLINLLLAQIRKDNHIALAVASSGIASTLLSGGRTAHSALKLPINLTTMETPICNISKNSERATVLKQCKLLVWDECTMSHKRAVEALDRTLRDLRSNRHVMGGMVVLLAGDFRQTLPVIQRGTPADEISACIKKSVLWECVQKLHLKENMRVRLYNDDRSGQYAANLLKIGDGKLKRDKQGRITFPPDFCNIVTSLDDLVRNVFPNFVQNYHSADWLCERAILAPRNDAVNFINSTVLMLIPGNSCHYISIDSVADEEQAVQYPVEFLNSLELSGVPSHKLELKVGAPVMLMRNLDAPKLCNGTRLIVKALGTNIIEATILNGVAKGESVLIPRIPLTPSDLPFQFKRLQFPLKLAFAMTINKSQGQTLKVAGIHLENQCFSHGQLYVACSRVSCGQNLYIYTTDGDGKATNIVYKQVLQN